RARAEVVQGPRHPDHFPTARHQDFLRRVAHDLAVQGRFLACRLRVNGAIVASRLVFLTHNQLYFYYSGFDPAWSRYSVATTTMAECIKLAIERGLKAVNLSPGTDQGKTRWGGEEH